MYKVFFNNSFIGFADKEDAAVPSATSVINYENLNQIQNWLSVAERGPDISNRIFIHPKPEDIWQDFKSIFNVLEAAGGLVLNKKNEILFIYKRGKWDLPKGKIDKGEKPRETAVREVCEETGLSHIKIIYDLANTYHIYRHKDKLVLKKTYWFLIKNKGSDDLIIQKEENIEKASWFDPNQLSPILSNSYGSINDVFNIYKLHGIQ